MAFTLPAYHAPDFTEERLAAAPNARWAPVEQDGVAPEGYHSTSMYPEYIKLDGRWYLAEESRMDASIVWREDGRLDVVENRSLRRGDRVILALSGGADSVCLTAVLRELSDMYDTESGISLRSVKLTESGGKKYADLVFTLDAGGLISDETLGGLLPEYISVGVRAEVTEGKGTVRDGAKIISFNGLTEDGGVAGIEELTCERLLDALGAVLPAVNFDEILTSVSDGLNQMVDNISEYFPGAVFVTK